MSNRTTFRLPGYDLNPSAERKCLIAFLAAYSKRWNERNMESPWYDPWQQILAALVAGHSSLSVSPQPRLWYDESINTAHRHSDPVPDYLKSTEDEQLDDVFSDVGNTTLDSIHSLSVPSKDDRTRIPDFAISRKVSFLRPHNNTHLSQLSRRVTFLGYPLIAELKRCGPRSDNIRQSLRDSRVHMASARRQLIRQAFHLFNMNPEQNFVILIAITGFWWSYRMYSRTQMEGVRPSVAGEFESDEEDLVDEEEDDDDGASSDEQDEDSENSVDATTQALQDQLQAYGFVLSEPGPMPDREESAFHTTLSEGAVKLDESGDWSDFLLYGTAPSNQVFSLILEYLHNVVHVHYTGERG